MQVKTIIEFINTYKTADRDKKVVEAINNYYRNNADALNDGIIEKYISFGNINRERILSLYNIPEADYKRFQKENLVLSSEHKVVNDLIKLCLMTSYHDTKDRIFLDMLSVIIIGSRFNQYFRLGISNPAKMKFILEKKLSNKFLIKKYGSLFLTTQAMVTTLITSDTMRGKIENLNDDENLRKIINSISTRLNNMMKEIANVYYSMGDSNETIYTQDENSSAEGKLSLTNNSITLQNLKNIIANYNPATIDYRILNILRIHSPVKRFFIQKLLLNTEYNYFAKIANLYIDYYVKAYGSDIQLMKKDFIPKSDTARMNSDELRAVENDITNKIKELAIEHVKNGGLVDDLNSNKGVLDFVKIIKKYAIIKTRELMNTIN